MSLEKDPAKYCYLSVKAHGVTTRETVKFLGGPEMETACFSKTLVQSASQNA